MTHTIKDIAELKALASTQPLHCKMVLKFGIVSKKTIRYRAGTFTIQNHIDGSRQTLTEDELHDSTLSNIGLALSKGALIHSE